MKPEPVMQPRAGGLATRRSLLWGLTGLGGLWGTAAAAAAELPRVRSLPVALAASLAQRQPLVVMVSLPGCAFCHQVRIQHLLPLARDWPQSVVQIDLRNPDPLIDALGVPTTQDLWARRTGVKVAPTLLFLGLGGAELAPRLVGALLPDFYGAYLDDRLNHARSAITKA